MSRLPHHRQSAAHLCNRPLQKLLSGLALIFFGASMMLPFQDDNVGLSAVFTLLGQPFSPLYWLFPVCTLAFVRLIFRLHDIRLPILKAGCLLLAMLLAVVHLYFNRNGIKVGAGVAVWLGAGLMLTAAAVRWRYPKDGILYSLLSLIIAGWLIVWVQSIFKDGNGGHIWHNTYTASAPALPEPPPPSAADHTPPPPENHTVLVAGSLNQLNPNSLIAVERDPITYNPWSEDKSRDCASAIRRHYPVLLPPRFIEQGHEWRNYQHGDDVCNTLIYVGTPKTDNAKADYHYKVSQDRRSNIYLVFNNKSGVTLFKDAFTINREQNELKKSDYAARLNAAFSRMVDQQGAEHVDNEYVFAKAPAPTTADTLVRGCNWQPVANQPNVFQWGGSRINWRGRTLLQPQTFCSKNLMGVVHLSAQSGSGQTNNRLSVKLFRHKDLKPIECGALGLTLQPADTQAWLKGTLQADSLHLTPASTAGTCPVISVKLKDGRKLSSAVQ